MRIVLLVVLSATLCYSDDCHVTGTPTPMGTQKLIIGHPDAITGYREFIFPARMTTPGIELLPSCPAMRTAIKVLRGDFGSIPEWKINGYKRIYSNGVYRKTAWVTHYWVGEPGVNNTTASGMRVQTGRTAAMLHHSGRRLRGNDFGYYVLVDNGKGMELRQVTDTGSPRNLSRARSMGAETWIDLYVSHPTSRTMVSDVFIERR